MKISREWLQTFFDAPLPDVHELSRALTFHAFEIESVEAHGGDSVLDVKVTPNRGHDCLSHRGIAKEISAILNIPLKNDRHTMSNILERKTDAVKVSIEEPGLCARYVAGYIKGVKVGFSPDWLKKRLHAMGQQSINNVVDATNFVMFNIGQPLHAFDAGKLRGLTSDPEVKPRYAIEVRKARKGEKMIALDENEYILNESMLVIGDKYADISVGIAGVKGGMASGIDDTTADIIIESANFNGVSVRRTAQALKLRTDASSRFEQVISPELAAYGMRAAIELILKLSGGELVGFADEYPRPQEKKNVSVTLSHINRLLGTARKASEVEDALTRLMLPFEKSGETYSVAVPFERLDITIPEDLIEEVGRIVGYDKVAAAELPVFPKPVEVNQDFAASEQVREDLIAKGYSEVYTSVFAGGGARQVLNKVGGGKSYLRTNLKDGLTDVLERNIHNKDLLGLKEVKLFEIGTVWPSGGEEEILVGTISEKEQAQEKSLSHYGANVMPENLPVSQTERYQPFSRFPSITRDIALWVPSGVKPEGIESMIRSHAGELLIRIDLFDQFEKGGKTSFAFRLVFQSFDKTLTDDDANHRMESIYKALRTQGYEIR
ncbi:MAG: Phenylalanine-tRNA ligase beta subunit [Parcubacteria group bacterium Gr01-1014_8]|nr:MAG: Phenylalanine-tRNA ligase beta subunit [Parcubacteria group bacterium Gr01-1014_8]